MNPSLDLVDTCLDDKHRNYSHSGITIYSSRFSLSLIHYEGEKESATETARRGEHERASSNTNR